MPYSESKPKRILKMNRLQKWSANLPTRLICYSPNLARSQTQVVRRTLLLFMLITNPMVSAEESALTPKDGTVQRNSPITRDSNAQQDVTTVRNYSIFFQTSLYSMHFNDDPEDNNRQNSINFEWRKNTGFLLGFAYFKNTFYQPSQYLYGGKIFRPFDNHQYIYFKITGGLLHGYKGEYKDKIPFNSLGVAPAILPAAGLSYKNFTTELVPYGIRGIILTLGYDFR